MSEKTRVSKDRKFKGHASNIGMIAEPGIRSYVTSAVRRGRQRHSAQPSA